MLFSPGQWVRRRNTTCASAMSLIINLVSMCHWEILNLSTEKTLICCCCCSWCLTLIVRLHQSRTTGNHILSDIVCWQQAKCGVFNSLLLYFNNVLFISWWLYRPNTKQKMVKISHISFSFPGTTFCVLVCKCAYWNTILMLKPISEYTF